MIRPTCGSSFCCSRRLIGQTSAGFFHYLALGSLMLILTPIAIAIGFSIWAGTRPRDRAAHARIASVMTLHFAYGSNMSRALMRARCPRREALGVATLARLALRHHPRRRRLDRAAAGRAACMACCGG